MFQISYVTVQMITNHLLLILEAHVWWKILLKHYNQQLKRHYSQNQNRKKVHELWKDDSTLNELLDQRSKEQRCISEYRDIPKKVNKHVRHLKNLKLKQEANEINSHATKREVEEHFRCGKSDGSTFKNTNKSNRCDPEAPRKHFKEQFSLMT